MPVFPATESTLSAAHLGEFLKTKYSLSQGATCSLFRTGMNHLYMIADGETKYVFRVYTHGWRSRGEILEEVRLLLHFRDSNVPVSYPVPDSGGEYVQQFDAIEGLRIGVLYSYAPGRKVPLFSADYAYRAGLAMGKMHISAQNMELRRTVYDYETLVGQSLRTVQSFFGFNNEDVQFLVEAGAYLQQHLFPDVGAMRNGAVHLDIWFDNMHFDETGQVTLFDFDFCGTGPQAIDVGYFLYQLYCTNHATGGYEEKAAAFLRGYNEMCTLTEEEQMHLGKLALSTLLYYIGIQCAKYDTWSNIFLNEDHLRRYVGSLKRWLTYNNIKF